MPRDKRLWMTFPIDMHRHPKITRLPLSARWAFFEMNGEARIEDNDGVFAVEDAEHQWGKKVLDQLVKSHPTRPLVVRDGDVYRIREFGEHQETRADREARQRRNQENGSKGGRPRKNPVGSDSVATGNRLATHGNPESESESEIDPDPSNTKSVSPVSNRARNLGLTDKVIGSIVQAPDVHADIQASRDEAAEFGAYVLELAPTQVRYPGAYVRSSIGDNPTETGQWFTRHRKRGNAA